MSSVLAVFGRSELNLGRVDDSKDGEGVEMDGRFGGRGVMERIVHIRNILLSPCFKGLTHVDVKPLLFIKIVVKHCPLTGREEDIGRTVAEALTELKRRVFGRDSLDGYLYMYIRSIKPSSTRSKCLTGGYGIAILRSPGVKHYYYCCYYPSIRLGCQPMTVNNQSASQSINQAINSKANSQPTAPTAGPRPGISGPRGSQHP